MDKDKVRGLLYESLEALGRDDKSALNRLLKEALDDVDVSYCRGCGCEISGDGDGYGYCNWCA